MGRLGWATGFVVCWSSGFVGAVLAEPAGSMAGVLAWRYVVTAVLVWTTVLVLRRGRVTLRDLAQQGVLGFLSHVVFLGGVFGASAGGVSAGTVALVCALQPMLVTLAGRVGWGDAVSGRQVAGLLAGLGAVVVTVRGDTTSPSAALVLPVVSLMGLSGAALLERRWRPSIDVLSGLCIQATLSAGVFVAYAASTGELTIPLGRDVAWAVAWLVLLSGLGGYASFVVCLRTLGSTTTSLLLYLTPPVTTLWAWAMFHDLPTVAQWWGLSMGAIAVGLAWPANSSAEDSASAGQPPARRPLVGP